MPNTLYFGDNLDILRRYVADETVDLVYLDPPFNSAQDYNVLFKTQQGDRSPAQIKAFEDTWRWDRAAAEAFEDVVTGRGRDTVNVPVSQTMQAFRKMMGETDMLAYLAMMAPRLVELHRVLRPTGSLYLHCDPTASHYLKLLLDAVFGPEHFRNEVIWKRTSGHSSAKRWGPAHDTILFYAKSDRYVWNPQHEEYDPLYIQERFGREDSKGPWKDADLTGAGVRTGDSGDSWRGFNPTDKGRHWAVSREAVATALLERDNDDRGTEALTSQEKLDLLDATDRIYWPSREGAWPRLKQYLDDMPGVAAQDVINDIPPLNSQAAERLGYPTQKPVALLERIIEASSTPGDLVLDPFCGCGTTIDAAQKLGRRWIGIDVTHLAVSLMKHRLRDTYENAVAYEVVGEPTSLDGATALAGEDRYQFQYWALGLVGARPHQEKKGADQGVDGRLFFHDDPKGGTKQVIVQVKSGKVSVRDVRDLVGTVEREGAQLGVLLTLESPTGPMSKEAYSAGFYESPYTRQKYPRVQVLTAEELLDGYGIEMPPLHLEGMNQTFRRAPRARRGGGSTQSALDF